MNRFYGKSVLRLEEYVIKPHILGKAAYWSYGFVIIVRNEPAEENQVHPAKRSFLPL
jgi:hypothetical protein